MTVPNRPPDRLRTVVLTAFACIPGAGSEPGAGWLAVETAAHLADRLVVLTGEDDPEEVRRAAVHLPAQVEVHRVPVPVADHRAVYLRYLAWLWACARHLDRLTGREHVDVVHHVTYASDWLPAPAALARKRCRTVWGPVGGASYPPLSALRHLSARAAAKDVARRVITGTVRHGTVALMRGRTDAAIALNADSQRHTSRVAPSAVHPNAGWDEETTARFDAELAASADAAAGPPTVLFAGRLLEWKGAVLAVQAVRATQRGWRLEVLGDGPAAARVVAAAAGDPAVEVVGRVPREEVLRRMSRARAFLLPSLHDSAPWGAAEAAAAGLPVVCLDVGGVAAMAGDNAVVVPVLPSAGLVGRLARQLDELVDAPRRPALAWTTTSLRRAFAVAYGLESD